MPGGRPLKFKSVEGLQKKIDAYFDSCWRKDPLGIEDPEMIRPYTISGLAYFLGTSRQTLLNYEKNEEFFVTLKGAKDRIQAWTEEQLFRKTQVAGPIFNLKNNWGFHDQQDHKVSTADGKPLGFEVNIVEAGKK